MNEEELKEYIKKEGNIRVIAHKGIIGLILRPRQLIPHLDDCYCENSGIHLTGYALIPTDSRLGRKLIKMGEGEVDKRVDVHGGITMFVERKGVLWIGFDTAHLGDISLLDDLEGHKNSDISWTYKTIDYVEEQLRGLIEQLLEVGKRGKGKRPT